MIASFGTYFIGFAVRPVGGVIFGILGDRLGRKFELLATIVLMGAASTLIGVLPTYATVGFWAPVMLISLRLLQGLGAGAEQAGAAVLMTEYAPRERRGVFASLPFLGIQLGPSRPAFSDPPPPAAGALTTRRRRPILLQWAERVVRQAIS